MRRSLRLVLGLAALLPALASAPAAEAATCTAVSSGPWNDPATWSGCAGGSGAVAGTPGASDNVTVPDGTTVTLTADAAVGNLSLFATSGTNVDATGFVLSISGMLDGPSTTFTNPILLTGTTGWVQFVGATRQIIGANWGAWTNSQDLWNWRMRVALDAGATGTVVTALKARRIHVQTGTLDVAGAIAATESLSPARGGDLVVDAGATLVGRTTTGARYVASTTSTTNGTYADSLIINGTLDIRGNFLNGEKIVVGPTGRLLRQGSTLALSSNPGGFGASNFVYQAGATLEYGPASGAISSGAEINQSSLASTKPIPVLIVDNPGNGSSSTGLNIQATTQVTTRLTLKRGRVYTSFASLSYGSGATLEYAGTTAQTAASTSPVNIEFPSASGPTNVTINNAAGVTLAASRSIAGTLTFTQGTLTLGSTIVSIGASGSIVGAQAGRHVVTNGTGRLSRLGQTGAFTFPVGPTAASYNPVTITNTGSAVNFNVRVKSSFTVGPPDATKTINREWDIVPSADGANATLAFSWETSHQNGAFNPSGSVVVGHLNASDVWEEFPATIAGSGTAGDPYVMTVSGITSFSPFAVGNAGALPVELGAFTVRTDGPGALALAWTTVSETNNAGFSVEVQRAGEASWTERAVRTGRGTTSEAHTYTARLDGLPAGPLRVRLRQTDLDGSVRVLRTETVTVGVAGEGEATVVNGRLRVVVAAPQAVRAVLYDALGRRVALLLPGGTVEASAEAALPAGLAAGRYFVRVDGERFRRTISVVE